MNVNRHMETFERPEVIRRRWLLLAVLCAALVLVVMSVAGLNVALAQMRLDLRASSAELEWIVDSYTIVFGGMLLTAGALADRYGRRTALLVGLGVFAFGSLLAMTADDSIGVIVSRAVMGLGAAFVMPATLSLISVIFRPEERARAIAIWAGFAGAGAALGGVLTGLLLSGFWFVPAFGWRASFVYPLVILIVVVIVTVIWMPQSKSTHPLPLDPWGVLLSIVGATALIYAIIEGASEGWTAQSALGGLVIAAVALTMFVLWERKNPRPMLPMSLFGDVRFAVGSLALLFAFLCLMGLFYLYPLYTQYTLGYSALAAGVATLPLALSQLVFAAPSAGLAVKVGPIRLVSLGLLLMAVSFAGLTLAERSGSYAAFLLPLLGVGAGMALATIPATNLIMAATPDGRSGIGSAVNDAARELGSAVGIATLGGLAAWLSESTLEKKAFTQSDLDAAERTLATGLDADGASGGTLSPERLNEVVEALSNAFGNTMLVSAAISILTAVAIWIMHRRSAPREGA